jgi:hypothetical protein
MAATYLAERGKELAPPWRGTRRARFTAVIFDRPNIFCAFL